MNGTDESGLRRRDVETTGGVRDRPAKERVGTEDGPGTEAGVGTEDGAGTAATDLPPAAIPDEGESCSVCGDEGRIGVVLGPATEDGMARVRFEEEDPGGDGARGGGAAALRRVAMDLVEDAEPGDRVVVHMGFAIARVREEA